LSPYAGLANTFCIAKKVFKKASSKKAIAKHRSFSLQNAFSIAIFTQFLGFCACLAIDALLLLHSLLLVFERNVFKKYLSKMNG